MQTFSGRRPRFLAGNHLAPDLAKVRGDFLNVCSVWSLKLEKRQIYAYLSLLLCRQTRVSANSTSIEESAKNKRKHRRRRSEKLKGNFERWNSEKRSEQEREKTGKEVARINERKRKKVHDEKRGKNKPGVTWKKLRRDRENRYGGEQKRRTTREGELARARH